jgi:hypothetical protein
VGQTLVIIGLIVVAIGAAIWMGVPLGRLPGDIVWRRGGFTFYLPIATSILVSLALTLLAMILRR